MTPSQFFSPDPSARIEPVDFMRHFLVQRGLDATSVGLRQTVIVPLIPALERRLLRVLGAPEPQPHPIQHQALYHPADYPFSVIASPMGAPMAVRLMKQFIALEARQLFYLEFCVASYRPTALVTCFYLCRLSGRKAHPITTCQMTLCPALLPICRPYSTLRHRDGSYPSSKGPSGRPTHRTAKPLSRSSNFKRLACTPWTWKWPPYSLWASIVSARWEHC